MAVGAVENNLFGDGLDAYLALQMTAPKTQAPVTTPGSEEVRFPQGGTTGTSEVPALRDPSFQSAIKNNIVFSQDREFRALGKDAFYTKLPGGEPSRSGGTLYGLA